MSDPTSAVRSARVLRRRLLLAEHAVDDTLAALDEIDTDDLGDVGTEFVSALVDAQRALDKAKQIAVSQLKGRDLVEVLDNA